MNPEVLFAIGLLAVVLLFLSLLGLRRLAVRRRNAEVIHAQNLARQRFLIEKMDAMKTLFANPDMPSDELKARQYLLLAEMESQNVDGNLDPLIADTALYLEEEFSKRDSR